MLEFQYLNKRLEDKILFTIGFYEDMPDDERNPVWPEFQKKDVKLGTRPKSAVYRPLDFNSALAKATESSCVRLKNAYQ